MVNLMTFYKAKYMQYEGLASTVRLGPSCILSLLLKCVHVCLVVSNSLQTHGILRARIEYFF